MRTTFTTSLSLVLPLLATGCLVGEPGGLPADDTPDDTPDAAPPDDTPDAATPSLGHAVKGAVVDYGSLAAATPDKVPNVALATAGMDPPLATESDATGAYSLANILPGTAFYVRAMPAGVTYVPTTSPPLLVSEQDLTLDVAVVSKVYKDRQNTTTGTPLLAKSSLVIADMTDIAGLPVAGVPLEGVTLSPVGAATKAGVGPYFMGALDVDTNALVSVAYPGYGARVAFLNVPTGEYDLKVTYTPADAQAPVTATVRVTTYDDGVTLQRVALGAPGGGPGLKFSTDVYPILQRASQGGQDCAACHNATGLGQLLPMDDGAQLVYDRLKAGTGLIDLATPANSLLLTMPLYETPPNHPNATWLDTTNPNYVKVLTWIQGGAPF